MRVAVADADEAVIAIIEYAASRLGASVQPVSSAGDVASVEPDLLFIDTRHLLHDPAEIEAIRQAASVPVYIIALDTMTGFHNMESAADYVLPKPFSPADLVTIMEQLSAV